MSQRAMRSRRLLAETAGETESRGQRRRGGLNSKGCHTNRKTGGYHCHRALCVVAVNKAQQSIDALAERAAASPQAVGAVRTKPIPGGPTCYVGPRGGTYTITKIGKKNYSGC